MSVVEEDEDEFLNQLKQEELERLSRQEAKELSKGLTYTDDDGTVMEWDHDKKAYFPKIDADFIAQYQINYGAASQQAVDDAEVVSEEEQRRRYEEYWSSYYQAYSKEQPKMPTLDVEGNEVEDEEGEKKEGKKKDKKETEKKETSEDGESSAGGETKDWDPTSEEVYQYNLYYYGQEYADEYRGYYRDHPDEAAMPDWYAERSAERESFAETQKNKGKKKTEKGEKRKEPPPPREEGWFEADQSSSTQIYISGLPDDVTEDEYKELCAKCGMIMFDPQTHKPKLKLYRDKEGNLKGDGLCTYIKSESVDLALNILDDYELRGHHLTVERAKFELKGDFDPKKNKKKKLSNKAKQKLKEKQQRLFDWRPDRNPFERAKHERTMVLRNMFEVAEFEADPSLITELRADVREECGKFGEIKKVVLYDRNPAGIITVTFSNAEEADQAIAALNGRWFAKKRIQATSHDGKTKYEIEETPEERDKRLREWEAFLAGGGEGKVEKDKTKGETSVKKNDETKSATLGGVEVEDVEEPDGLDTGGTSEPV